MWWSESRKVLVGLYSSVFSTLSNVYNGVFCENSYNGFWFINYFY